MLFSIVTTFQPLADITIKPQKILPPKVAYNRRLQIGPEQDSPHFVLCS